jgi:regulatory protein
MLRAGHGFDAARAVIDAATVAEAEGWASEAEENP